MKKGWARLAGQRQYGDAHWLQFRLDDPWPAWSAGQWIAIQPVQGWDPYLPRTVLPIAYQTPFFTIAVSAWLHDAWLADLSAFAPLGKRIIATAPRGRGFSVPSGTGNLFLWAEAAALPYFSSWLQSPPARLNVFLRVDLAADAVWQPPFPFAPAIEYQRIASQNEKSLGQVVELSQWADTIFMVGPYAWFQEIAWRLPEQIGANVDKIQVLLPDSCGYGIGAANDGRLQTERGWFALLKRGPVFRLLDDYLSRRRL